MESLLALVLALTVAGGALAAEPQRDGAPDSAPATDSACADCGVVLSVGDTGRDSHSWTNTLGAGGGGEPSSGRPQAIGVKPSQGSIVGRSSEFRPHAEFTVRVRMSDGSIRRVRSVTRPAVSPGDNVRVAGNVVFLR